MYPESVSGIPELQGRQQQVGGWIRTRFGAMSLFDAEERIERVIEENFELTQAAGVSRARIDAIADHVYKQEPGELRQEAAGLVVTLLGLAVAHGFDLLEETDREIMRILHVPAEVSRLKQRKKAEAGIALIPQIAAADPEHKTSVDAHITGDL
jgi:hypothetical protein